MATNRLKSARLTNDTLLSKVDDEIGSLEQALCDILGLTPDSDVTVSTFAITNAGKVTRDVVPQRSASTSDPSSVGIGIEDSVSGKRAQFGIFPLATVSSGSGNPPVKEPVYGFSPRGGATIGAAGGELCFGIRASTGTLLGKIFGNGTKGLVPKGSGNPNEYMNALGSFHPPDALPAELFSLKTGYSAHTPGTIFYTAETGAEPGKLYWQSEDYDPSGMHVAGEHQITIPTTGHYLFSASVSILPQKQSMVGEIALSIENDTAGTVIGITQKVLNVELGGGPTTTTPKLDLSIDVDAVAACTAGDKLHVKVLVSQTVSTNNPDVYTIPKSWFSGERIG